MARVAPDVRLPCLSGGMTLVELMMAIAIMGILASLAAPGFMELIKSNRTAGQVNDVLGALNLARAEAVKRGTAVTVCKSSDFAACTSTGTDWSIGWMVFSDPNANATVDTGETVLRAYPALSAGATAASISGNTGQSITFLPIGRPVASFTGGEIKVCPANGANLCESICINPQGRPRAESVTQRAADTTCGS